jgi:hypothetical protein
VVCGCGGIIIVFLSFATVLIIHMYACDQYLRHWEQQSSTSTMCTSQGRHENLTLGNFSIDVNALGAIRANTTGVSSR